MSQPLLKALKKYRVLFETALLVALFSYSQSGLLRRFYFVHPTRDSLCFSVDALANTKGALTLAVLLLALWAGRKVRWQDHEHGRSLRLFTLVLFGIFGVNAIFGSYSLYLDTAFWLDRALMLTVLVGLWFRPSLAPLAFVMTLLSMALENWGVPGLLLTDRRLPVHGITMLAIWVLLGPLVKWSPKCLVVSLLSLTGASYYFPARQKLLLGNDFAWVFENKIENLMVMSRANGWFVSVDMQDWISIAGGVASVAVPLAIITLMVEFSGLLLPFVQKYIPVLLVLFALFHLGVLLTTGIFFWKWMVFELVLAWLLYRGPREWVCFSWPLRIMMVGLMVYSGNVFEVQGLGWFDTPYDQRIEIEALGHSGQRYNVPSEFFSPQEIFFAQSRLKKHYGKRRSIGSYGGTMNYPFFKRLDRAKDHEAVIRVVERTGLSIRPHSGRAVGYLRRTFKNANRFKRRPLWFFPHIPHIWQDAKAPVFDFQERIVSVDVILVESSFKNGEVQFSSRESWDYFEVGEARIVGLRAPALFVKNNREELELWDMRNLSFVRAFAVEFPLNAYIHDEGVAIAGPTGLHELSVPCLLR